MNVALKGAGLLSLLVLVGAGCAPATTPTENTTAGDTAMENTQSGDAMMEKNDGDAMMQKDGAMMEKDGDAMMEKDDSAMMKDDTAMKKDGDAMEKQVLGSYTEYTPEAVANAETEDVVLFFHAKWCSSCKALHKDISANAASIPAGLTILQADYDAQTDLKKKYGVTLQHTFVQVDKDGNMIKKWNGGNTLDSVVSNVQ